jgi:hypothetical protein
VTATIVNGLTASTNYTKDFTITVTVAAPFVPVTNITLASSTVAAGTPLTLSGTVIPSTATNQTIIWSVKTQGTTGATITSGTDILNTTSDGSAVVTATIVNGLTASTNYTKDFTITVNSSTSKDIISFTFNDLTPPVTGTIDGTVITVVVPGTTDKTSLEPTIAHTGASCSPSGAQDFTGPVTYTVTAADTSSTIYTVKVYKLIEKPPVTNEAGLRSTISSATNNDWIKIPISNNISISTPTIQIVGSKKIELIPNGSNVTISRPNTPPSFILFEVQYDAELTLSGSSGKTLTIKGGSPNGDQPLLTVNNGKATMKDDAIIEDFLGSENPIQVLGGGIFILDGGIIRNNRSGNANGGGAVLVSGTSRFIMKNGVIYNNQALNDVSVPYPGGGISLLSSYFDMIDGTISGNTGSSGAGVYLDWGSTINKTGGTIYGDNNTTHTLLSTENTASTGNGHAVYSIAGSLKRNTTAGTSVNLSTAVTGAGSNWE